MPCYDGITCFYTRKVDFMSLSQEELRNLAVVARIKLADENVESMTAELNSVLDQIKELTELDLQGVERTVHAVEGLNATRKDELRPGLSIDQVLLNAPEKEGRAILVPQIVSTEGGE